ncbi:hypothetical protein K439DRAFT_1665948 [Ramaria rubella]|nr:hypothetical protein K439DRAFT_1665948 [Ramaria rubella]
MHRAAPIGIELGSGAGAGQDKTGSGSPSIWPICPRPRRPPHASSHPAQHPELVPAPTPPEAPYSSWDARTRAWCTSLRGGGVAAGSTLKSRRGTLLVIVVGVRRVGAGVRGVGAEMGVWRGGRKGVGFGGCADADVGAVWRMWGRRDAGVWVGRGVWYLHWGRGGRRGGEAERVCGRVGIRGRVWWMRVGRGTRVDALAAFGRGRTELAVVATLFMAWHTPASSNDTRMGLDTHTALYTALHDRTVLLDALHWHAHRDILTAHGAIPQRALEELALLAAEPRRGVHICAADHADADLLLEGAETVLVLGEGAVDTGDDVDVADAGWDGGEEEHEVVAGGWGGERRGRERARRGTRALWGVSGCGETRGRVAYRAGRRGDSGRCSRECMCGWMGGVGGYIGLCGADSGDIERGMGDGDRRGERRRGQKTATRWGKRDRQCRSAPL